MRIKNASQSTLESNDRNEVVDNASPSLMKRLQSLAGSTRTKVAAAFLAAAGAVESANKVEAAIMRQAEVVPGLQVNEIGDDEFGFGWDSLMLRIDNLEDQSNRDMHWIGFRSMDETTADAALPAPGHTPVPDQIIGPNAVPEDGIVSQEIILNGQLQVRENFFVVIGINEGNDYDFFSLDHYLENSEVFIGTSPIEGDAQNIDDAIAMTNGVVYQGTIPSHLDPNSLYVIRPAVHTPEPSTAILGGLAAAGLAVGTAGRRRRKSD